jgi:hypothetical protein
MIRQAAPLDEIGELLRHRSPYTTAIYAKVDLPPLRSSGTPLAGRCPMKRPRQAAGDYLALRCSLGFKLKEHERFLRQLLSFLKKKRSAHISI